MSKKTKAAERQRFHRQQLNNPGVLQDELDPDSPILLPDHLKPYDRVILSQLHAKGWPNTSGKNTPPNRVKGASLAAKITRKNNLPADDATLFADRIN